MRISLNYSTFLFLILLSSPYLICSQESTKPNVIIIYADDLGYGDIEVNGAKGVRTPNVNMLAAKGVNFSDAHSSAATCTPSRYSLLTGKYAFRRNANILDGDAPLLIDTSTRTIADMFNDAGYTTGVVGKWHLGLGDGTVNWNERVSPGPKEIGFDYSFLIPATGDRVPTVYLENQRVYNYDPEDPITIDYKTPIPGGFPTGTTSPELLKQYTDQQHLGSITNGISRIGFMKGGSKALWVDEDMADVLTQKAQKFIRHETGEKPFFLFFSLHDIHQPRIANARFIESSSMGPRGDVIVQMDACIGAILKTLKTLGIEEETLILFTSDNGPILDDGYVDYARELVGTHHPGGPFRGSKYSIYEAGTRMPTILYWPGTVQPGNSSALLSQVDLYASFAELVGERLGSDDALDSHNHLDAWLGKTQKGREELFEQAYAYALREGSFKYIQAKTNAEIPGWLISKHVDPGFSTIPLLFDLSKDPGEVNNIAKDYPDKVAQMEERLAQILKTPTRK